MIKKREKKVPMFVSSINTNYQFVDYTQPDYFGQVDPSANSHPEESHHFLKPSAASPKLEMQPKQENNWSQQMRQPHQNKNGLFTANGKSEVIKQKITAPQHNNLYAQQQGNSGYCSQFKDVSKPSSAIKTWKNQNIQFSFKKQQISPNIENNSNQFQNSYEITQFSIHSNSKYSPNQQTKERESKKNSIKLNDSFQTKQKTKNRLNQQPFPNKMKLQKKSQTGYLSNFSKDQQKAQKNEKPSLNKVCSALSGTLGGDFTDQRIVNFLPEPSRSNVLAIIRRNKEQSY